jgi:signal transduction histidine kinase
MERPDLSYDDVVPGLVRSVWNEPRPAHPPARGWRDWALVVALVTILLLEGLLRPDLPWRALSVIITVGLTPTLLWRRSRPLLMVAIVFGVSAAVPLVTGGEQLGQYGMLYLLLLPYSLFRWGSGREILLGSVIISANVLAAMALRQTTVTDTIGGLAVLFGTAAIGSALRFRTAARVRLLDQVKLLERERFARDLHDTVAHHVSAMAIRAQAGIAMAATQPAAATEALHIIEAEASLALAEMRAMVRVLRTDQPAELTPSPRIADLATLAGRPRGGPAVEVDISGDLAGLPASIETAIYRLTQESVTNARRHARHATRIEVRIGADDSAVRLRVTDDGDHGPGAGTSPGYGLVGMFERASLLGGVCQAGPNTGRGWTVTATLPRTVSA